MSLLYFERKDTAGRAGEEATTGLGSIGLARRSLGGKGRTGMVEFPLLKGAIV